MAIFGLTIELVKLVYKIIEGIIRALLEAIIRIVIYIVGGISAVTISIFAIRYGVCEEESCFADQSLLNLAVVSGCALTLFAAYTAAKSFF